MDFGNNASDGYTARTHQYQPKWEKNVDHHPDHQPSNSNIFREDLDAKGKVIPLESSREIKSIRWALQVKGLGVMVFHTKPHDSEDALKMGIFTKEDLGPCPDV